MNKYRIIGANGQMYGPVTLEVLQQWLAEGRVDSRTPVYISGAANWTYLSLLPEFAPATASAQPPTIGVVTASTAAPPGTNGFAVAGLVCGLLAWTCCCLGIPLNILGTVFCVIALLQISAQPVPQQGKALSIVGLVLCLTNMAFYAMAFLISLLSNPDNVNFSIGSG